MRGMLSPHDRSALRFVARHLAMGLAAGALFGLAILASDLAGLRSLAFASEAPWLVIALLFFGLFITFGSVSLAANLMLLERGEQDSHDDRQ
jgi:ABC-type transport system involved in cytochrome c biogenesis permease subunit